MNNVTTPAPGWYHLEDLFRTVPYRNHVIVAVIMIVIFLLAVFGNGLVILVFIISRKLRSPSNLLVVNLAVADIFMALTGFPILIINSFKGRWVFPDWTCSLYGATATSFGLMSMNTLVFISLDRYVAIISPCHLKKVSYRHSRFCLFAIWFYSAIWGLMPTLGWNRYIVEGYGTTCSIDYFDHQFPSNFFLMTMFLADYIIPCTIVLYCYSWIFYTVKNHSSTIHKISSRPKDSLRRSFSDNPSGAGDLKQKGQPRWSTVDYKVAKTIFIVLLFYLLAWTPYAVVTMIGQYGNATDITPTLSMLPAVFAKFSTVYNPIIYSLTHPKFKEEVTAVLKRMFSRKQIRDPTRRSHSHRLFNDTTNSDSISAPLKGKSPLISSDIAVESIDMSGGKVKYKKLNAADSEEGSIELLEAVHEKQYLQPLVDCSNSLDEEEDEGREEEEEEEHTERRKGGMNAKHLTSVLTKEEEMILERAMSNRRQLPTVVIIRPSRLHSISEEKAKHKRSMDISGESLMSVNIEAIKMENSA